MEKINLNGHDMRTREDAHDALARALHLPEYYGRNLDALWDLVSTMEADVLLTHPEALGDYGQRLVATLQEAAEENPRFRFEIQAQ